MSKNAALSHPGKRALRRPLGFSRRSGRAHHRVAAVPMAMAAASVASGHSRRETRKRRLWNWFAAAKPKTPARRIPGTSMRVSSRGIQPSNIIQPKPMAKNTMKRSERRRGPGARMKQITATATARGPTITPDRRSTSISRNPKTPITTEIENGGIPNLTRRAIAGSGCSLAITADGAPSESAFSMMKFPPYYAVLKVAGCSSGAVGRLAHSGRERIERVAPRAIARYPLQRSIRRPFRLRHSNDDGSRIRRART